MDKNIDPQTGFTKIASILTDPQKQTNPKKSKKIQSPEFSAFFPQLTGSQRDFLERI
jgi:hypothetical protein